MYIEVETIECPCCKTKWQYATCLSRNNIQNAEPFKTDSIFECPSCGKKWVIGLTTWIGDTGDELVRYGFSGRIMTRRDRSRFPYLTEARFMIIGDDK